MLTKEQCELSKFDGLNGQIKELTAENTRLIEANRILRESHTLQTVLRQQAELENARAVIKSECENEVMIEEMVKPYLTKYEIPGDSYGVPGLVGIVETLCKKLEQAQEDTARLDWILQWVYVLQIEAPGVPSKCINKTRQAIDAAMNAEILPRPT